MFTVVIIQGNEITSLSIIFLLLENMSRKNFSPSLEVKLNDSVIHFSENKQSIYLEEIKCISPPSINSLSEIQKIEFDQFDKELNNMYYLTTLWILLPKCEELRSLILTSNIENLTP